MKASRLSRVVGLAFVLVQLAAVNSTPARRFATPDGVGASDNPAVWCHRVHLLPVGSLLRSRALAVCENFKQSMPEKFDGGPGNPDYDENKISAVIDQEKAKNIKAQQDRVRTKEQQAVLDNSDAVQAKLKAAQDTAAASAAARKAAADTATKEAAQDLLERQQQIRQQLDDHLKKMLNDKDKTAGADALRQDQLDVGAVDTAKAKWTEYQTSLADAKAKSASDAKVVEAYDVKIKAAADERKQDIAQQKADQAEAKADQDLADDAEKAARAKAREERAKEMQTRAEEREKTIAAARVERDAAIARQKQVNKEAEDTAKLKSQVDDTEAALAANRKSRQDEELERQKRMDAYAKEEAEIKARREAYEKAEKDREMRLKKRQEDEDLRLKAKKDEDARLAKAEEDNVPHEERTKQDNEEDCKDKSVSCGSGKCFQLKDDANSKRCQCEKDVKGKNCEHAACEYDVTDGVGKTSKQKGNQVDGQCVRWKSVYRCQCGKPWRLDLQCMKKEGVKEIQVPNTQCRGLREPENEYSNQICELCQCPRGRDLEANTTASTESDRRLLNGCEDVKTCVSKRMALTTKRYYRPDLLALPKGDLYQAIPVASNEACLEQCERRAGMSGKASSDRRPLKARTHCTWVYIETDARTSKLTCYIFFTGELPELHDPNPNTAKRQKTASTGFVGFVMYPRRWELYRQATGRERSRKFCGGTGEKFEVFFGPNTAAREGEGTYARGAKHVWTDCIGQPETVLENAEGYAKRLPKKKKGELVAIPPEWVTYEDIKRKPAKVYSKNSQLPATQLPWTYTVDDYFRVTNVEGVSTTLHVGQRVDEEFETTYKWVTDRIWATAQAAPFCAGHLVAYQQLPPNFYFNYVPQHENSNSNGCWFLAEEAAANLIRLGCHLSYNINLDYRLHGMLKPSDIKDMMPDKAKDNPIIYKPPSRPKPGKTAAPRPPPSYVNDDLKCHYRYRPYIMNLNFHIVDTDATKDCANLYNAIQSRPATSLLSVSGKTLVTSRIFAYLLQKKPNSGDPETGKGTKSFKRMLGVATAMKKNANSAADFAMSCYAETGNIAPFTKVQMDLDFHDAYLGDVDHRKCLLRPGTKTCEKWSMEPDTSHMIYQDDSHFGVLLSSDGLCLAGKYLQVAVLEDELDPNVECGVFEYVVKGRNFEPSQLHPIQGVEGAETIDDFLIGTVTFGVDYCLDPNGKIVEILDPAEECWKLRISYYDFDPQRRALQDDGDDDDDDDQNGTCSAVEFTDDWDGEE